MKKTIWMAYDLGVRGDYPALYRWLDEVEAMECGDSLACFKIDIPDDNSPADFIKTKLQENVSFSRNDRVYLIWRGMDDNNHGRFIVGGRKASRWQGCSPLAFQEDDM